MQNYILSFILSSFAVVCSVGAYGQIENKDSLQRLLQELDSIAEYNYEIGKDSIAIAIGYQLLSIKEKEFGKNHIEYAKTLNNISKYVFEEGDYSKALLLAETSLSIIEKSSGYNNVWIDALSNLSSIYSITGQHEKAIKYSRKALNVSFSEYGENHVEYANSLYNLAECYYEYGALTNVRRLCEEALTIYQSNEETQSSEYATILLLLSNCMSSLGYNNDAVPIASEATEIFKQLYGNSHPSYAAALSSLSVIYSSIGDYNKAISISQDILDIYKRQYGTSHPYYITSLVNLASFKWDNGDYEECIDLANNALLLYKQSNLLDYADYYNALDWLSKGYLETKQYEKAVQTGTLSIKIKEKQFGRKTVDYANSLSLTSQCYAAKGDYKKAILYSKKAFKIFNKIYDDSHPLVADILDQISHNYSDDHNYKEALNYGLRSINSFSKYAIRNFQNMSSDQRQKLWNTINDRFQKFIGLAYRYPNSDLYEQIYNKVALFSKGILLNADIELQKIILGSGDSILVRKYYEMKELSEVYNALLDMPTNEQFMDVDSLYSVLQDREKELIQTSKDFRDFTPKLDFTWEDVQKSLKENDIAIEFVDFPLKNDSLIYAALVVKKDYLSPHFVPLFEIKELKSIPERTYYIRRTLSQLIWGPLQKELENVENIYFSPTGILHKIGIEYLSLEDSIAMCNKFNMYRLSSTKQLIVKHENVVMNNAIVYGGINYDTLPSENLETDNSSSAMAKNSIDFLHLRNSFGYLEGTKLEADSVSYFLDQHSIPYVYYSGNNGSEESFKRLNGKHFNLIHVATHGFYLKEEDILKSSTDKGNLIREDRPLTRSGLLFSGCNITISKGYGEVGAEDGILTAQEIASLDFRDLELVVLSACETGLGDISSGEGVFGLQRGFKKAGADAIMMSLWKVSDKATERLMTTFYQNYLSGMSKHDAFSKAREEVRKISSPRQTRPDWAAFIMLDGIN